MSIKLLSRDKSSAHSNIKTYFKVSIMLALISAILRSVAYFTSFDADVGYFNGSVFATAVSYIVILSCAFVLSGFIFISKEADLPRKLDNSGNAVFFSAVFAGFIMVADFAYKIYTLVGEDRFSYYKFIFDPKYKSEDLYFTRATAIIEIIGVAASLLSAVCFFLRSSKKSEGKLCIWLGFFPIVRALVGVAEIYFEMEVQMNHPSKLMLQFSLIALMICFLCEERFYVSEDHPRPRRFFISACVAFILAFAGGVSEMIGFFSGKLSKGSFCVEAFFCLTLSIYVLARLSSFVRSLGALKSLPEESADE